LKKLKKIKKGKKLKKIKKIYITTDFIMTKETEQASNRCWFKDLFSSTLEQVTTITPTSFYSSMTDKTKFSREKFFKLSNIDLDIDKIQFLYNSELITQESIDYLKTFIEPGTLLLAYELSEDTRKIINKLGITYIDIWLHPVRYMEDIMFGFYSNHKTIYNNLSKYLLNDEYIYNQATLLKIQNYKGWKRQNLKIQKNAGVFFGQTLEDKAIAKDGKFLTLLDFKQEIEEFAARHSTIYYIRHPYVKKGDEDILKYINSHPKIQVSRHTSYPLIADDRVTEIMSISSSLVHEASYFNKTSSFLYKSILNFDNNFEEEGYITIFQDFMSNKFWSEILSPVIKTKKYEQHITFLNKKDKLRDMLAFYWSYYQVDKLENLRLQTRHLNTTINKFNTTLNTFKTHKLISLISNLNLKNINKKSLIQPIIKHFEENNKKELIKTKRINNIDTKYNFKEECKKQIDNNDLISFDIFDTLLVRPFYHPNDLFNYMEAEIKEKYNIEDFKKVRADFRHLAVSKDSEEVNLDKRYMTLKQTHPKISEKEIEELYQLELNYERETLKKREFAHELYNYCKEQGKKIAITSDIFFSEKFIKELLEKNDFTDYDYMFLSSVEGKLKHTGNLFDVLLEKTGYAANKILHVGDNLHADIKQAKTRNINTLYIPSIKEDVKNKTELLNTYSGYKDEKLETLTKGLINIKLGDTPYNFTNSLINGDVSNFAYSIEGPIFFSFVKELIEKSISDNIKTLFFLSRDGEIIKKVYDILSPYYKNAPKSVYVYASRRSVTVPALETLEDIEEISSKSFNNCKIDNLFKNRFGIKIEEKKLETLGLNGNSIIKFSDKKMLKDLINISLTDILENAKEEKKELLNYYKKVGLDNPKNQKIGIVDIGHEGSIQKAIHQITGKKINGYYYATFAKIKNNVEDLGMETWGYIDNKITSSQHYYKKNILMFENLFLNSEGSFLRIKNGNPEFLSTEKEYKRIEFANISHDEIVNFSKDLSNILQDKIPKLKKENPKNIAAPYIDFLDNYYEKDLEIFKDIIFENEYNCNTNSDLLSDFYKRKYKQEVKLSLDNSIQLRRLKKLIYETRYYIQDINYKKFKKLALNPLKFLRDIKY